jgi:hypothetical protein
MIGYSQQLVKANKAADQTLQGVRLGKMCIEKDVPVTKVAEVFHVSRTAVYAWFTGKSEIMPFRLMQAARFIKKLEA